MMPAPTSTTSVRVVVASADTGLLVLPSTGPILRLSRGKVAANGVRRPVASKSSKLAW
jgi:hypothetical protein